MEPVKDPLIGQQETIKADDAIEDMKATVGAKQPEDMKATVGAKQLEKKVAAPTKRKTTAAAAGSPEAAEKPSKRGKVIYVIMWSLLKMSIQSAKPLRCSTCQLNSTTSS